MGCKVLAKRIGKPLESISGAKIHHSVEVSDLFEGIPDGQTLVIDLGKEATGLAYVQVWLRKAETSRRVGNYMSWPLDAIGTVTPPSDLPAFAKQLGFKTARAFVGFIQQKAKEGRVHTG